MVSPEAHVRYVDRMSVENLRAQYPELSGFDLVVPDLVMDGEMLSAIPDGSVDFVIANHFIEHCQNPIATLHNHLRVLRPGGILYMGVPDKRHTFDSERPLTSLEHVIRDYDEGPEWSVWSHYKEYARLVDGADNPPARARELMLKRYSIHYHVWTCESFLEFLDHCRTELSLPFAIEEVEENDFEFIVVMSKLGERDAQREAAVVAAASGAPSPATGTRPSR
jgi:SAM-dependent methyltransferase